MIILGLVPARGGSQLPSFKVVDDQTRGRFLDRNLHRGFRWVALDLCGRPKGKPCKKRCHSHFCNKLLDGAPFKNTQAASTGIWERKTQHTWRVFQQRLLCRHELWFLDDSNRSRCIKIQKDLSCSACIPQLLWRKQTHTLPPQVWCEFNLR